MSAFTTFWKRLFRRKPTCALVDQVLHHTDDEGKPHRLPLAQLRNWTAPGDPWVTNVTIVSTTGDILHWQDPDKKLADLLRRTLPEKEASATRGTL
jgi:hypothetical protein